jgi:hypothetical protein
VILSLIRALSTHLSLISLPAASHHLSSHSILQEQEYKAYTLLGAAGTPYAQRLMQ